MGERFRRCSTVAAAIATGASAPVVVAHPADNAQPLQLTAHLAPFGEDGSIRYTDVGVDDGLVCLSSDLSGTAIISVFSLSQPSVIGVYRADLPVVGLSMDGGRVALAAPEAAEVHLVDLSVPGTPAVIAVIPTGAWSGDAVALTGGELWVTSRTSPVARRYDVSGPGEPVLVGEMVTPDQTGLGVPTFTDAGVLLAGLGGPDGGSGGATYVVDPDAGSIGVLDMGRSTGSVAMDTRARLVSAQQRIGGQITLWSSSSPPSSSLVTVDASSYALNTIGPSRVAANGSIGLVAWYQAGVHVFDLDRVDSFGDLLRLGYYRTSVASPLEGFVGANAVVPVAGTRQVVACDSRHGLFVLDLDRVLPTICPCDFDVISGVNMLDLLTFVSEYVRGSLRADVDRDDVVGIRDLLLFLECWFDSDGAGCL